MTTTANPISVTVTSGVNTFGTLAWVTQESNRNWHIEHGDSPIFDALVAEVGDPYREPVSEALIARRRAAAKKLKRPEQRVDAKKARTPAEEMTIELAKLRKMTRPQLGSYIATNRQYLSDVNESYGGQTKKAVLYEAAVRIARAKIVGR